VRDRSSRGSTGGVVLNTDTHLLGDSLGFMASYLTFGVTMGTDWLSIQSASAVR
jgi:hypothetical protein